MSAPNNQPFTDNDLKSFIQYRHRYADWGSLKTLFDADSLGTSSVKTHICQACLEYAVDNGDESGAYLIARMLEKSEGQRSRILSRLKHYTITHVEFYGLEYSDLDTLLTYRDRHPIAWGPLYHVMEAKNFSDHDLDVCIEYAGSDLNSPSVGPAKACLAVLRKVLPNSREFLHYILFEN